MSLKKSFSLKIKESKIKVYFNYKILLDPVLINENYAKVKGGLPPGLTYEFLYKNNTTENRTLEHKTVNRYTRSLSSNLFLKIILNGRNQQWQKELFEIIKKKENVSIAFDENNFNVVSNANLNINFNDWENKIDDLISKYYKEFNIETIQYEMEQYDDIKKMLEKIEEIRKLYLIDYLHKSDLNILFLMGRKMHIEDFYERNESFKKFSKLYKHNKKAPTSNDNSVVIRSINIPKLKKNDDIFNKNGLINMLMPRLLTLKSLNEYTFNIDENIIDLNGPKKHVDETISLLNSNLPNIKCRKISINFNILNDTNFESNINKISNQISSIFNYITEEDEDTKKLIYKLSYKTNSNFSKNNNTSNLLEIYLTYFYNFIEINSNLDSVYAKIDKVLNEKFTLIKIDIQNHSSFLEDSKWKQFEQQNMANLACENKFFYCILSDQTGSVKIFLYGIKVHVDLVKIKIDAFFLSDGFKTLILSINQDDVTIFFSII